MLLVPPSRHPGPRSAVKGVEQVAKKRSMGGSKKKRSGSSKRKSSRKR